MGIFDASTSSGGSTNAAQNYAYNNSASFSQTNAAQAQAFSAAQAALAYERQKELQQMQMDFNREEAQKSRDWETEMANTIYTRSIKNMKEAGINPILAAGMGLSGASVGSGATASISGASAPMAQSFMDTSSASSAAGESFGESHGSSWNSSESGLATFLKSLEVIFGEISNGLQSGLTLDVGDSFDKLYDKLFPPETQTEEDKEVKQAIHNVNEVRTSTYKKSYKGNNKDYSGGLPKTGARGENVVY